MVFEIRKIITSGISSSEPDLTTAQLSFKTTNSGFPPGTTVDELFHYRKKRQPAFLQIHDHLKLEEGSFQAIKSEYKRRYRNDIYHKNHESYRANAKKPEDSLKVEGLHEYNPEYYESFIEYPIEKTIVKTNRNLIDSVGMEIAEDEENPETETEDQEKQATHLEYPLGRRHYLFKRPTNLKLEGDLCTETENAEKFIQYLLTGRPDLLRTPTTLKLEGDMETKTESSDKFIPFKYQSRPPLFKKSTNLHLEGILDITTETREKFLPFQPQQRPPLTKRGTNLHLEGDFTLQPEYRDVFVEHKEAERAHPKFPVHNLKPEGCIDTKTEKAEKFVEHQIHPVIPFLRGMDTNRKFTLGDDPTIRRAEYKEKFVEHPKFERHMIQKPKENLRPEGDMETITESKTQFVQKSVSKTQTQKVSNNLLLEGNLDMNPEYRNAYVNFYRDAYGKFDIKKGENEPERRKRRTNVNLKAEGDMVTNPEYKSSFVDFPRQRPSVKKPEGHLHSEGNWSHITEKRAQYVAHPKGAKAHPVKRQTELKLEGPFECQPEYRRAYIDYITREKASERQPRPLENLGIPPQRVFPESRPHTITEEKEEKAIQPEVPSEPPPQPSPQPSPQPPPPPSSDTGEGSAALPPEAKSKLSVPVTVENQPQQKKSHRRNSSLSPTPKISETKTNKGNISKMENCLFGPKVPNPGSRGRNESAKAQAERRAHEASQRARLARARRRYGSPVMVENLAYTPRTSPVPAILEASARGRWRKQDDSSKNHAFVVLGSVADECNNNSSNNINRKPCDRSYVGYKELYKEQKWMPSWYAPPSK